MNYKNIYIVFFLYLSLASLLGYSSFVGNGTSQFIATVLILITVCLNFLLFFGDSNLASLPDNDTPNSKVRLKYFFAIFFLIFLFPINIYLLLKYYSLSVDKDFETIDKTKNIFYNLLWIVLIIISTILVLSVNAEKRIMKEFKYTFRDCVIEKKTSLVCAPSDNSINTLNFFAYQNIKDSIRDKNITTTFNQIYNDDISADIMIDNQMFFKLQDILDKKNQSTFLLLLILAIPSFSLFIFMIFLTIKKLTINYFHIQQKYFSYYFPISTMNENSHEENEEKDLQNLINKAISKGDSETAQALLKILNNKKMDKK